MRSRTNEVDDHPVPTEAHGVIVVFARPAFAVAVPDQEPAGTSVTCSVPS
jgi:hypothetical protein